MSMYHSSELCYLAAVYNNLLIAGNPMDFYFRPDPAGLVDGLLRVSPDLLPPGRVRISEVEIDGRSHSDYDADALTVRVPQGDRPVKVRVRLAANPRSA